MSQTHGCLSKAGQADQDATNHSQQPVATSMEATSGTRYSLKVLAIIILNAWLNRGNGLWIRLANAT